MHAVWIVIIIILVFVGVFGSIKLCLKFSAGWDRSPTCLVGKTAIVTGANSGNIIFIILFYSSLKILYLAFSTI